MDDSNGPVSGQSQDIPNDPWATAILERAEQFAKAELQSERANPDNEREQRRRIVDSAARELTDMGVPALLIEPLVANTMLETSSIACVRRWRRRRSWLLVLHGDFGIGKDQAMAWHAWLEALRRAEARNGLLVTVPPCWFSAVDIASMSGRNSDKLERAARAPELFIEDLGEHLTAVSLALLGDLLNKRYGNRRRTLLTTNLNKVQLRELLGPRIRQRVNAGGVVTGVEGPNLRELGLAGEHGLDRLGILRKEESGGRAWELEGDDERPRTIVQPRHQYRARILSPRAQARRRQLLFRFA